MESKASVPEGFTLQLALVDALPVLFFGVATLVLGAKMASPVFAIGAVLCFVGGAGKVAWKLVIALAHKNIPMLAKQMRILMPAGFAIMVAGAALSWQTAAPIFASLGSMPSIAFIVIWISCMFAMGYFAGHGDQTSARDNWIEQFTNAAGQAARLAAVLFLG